MDRPATVSVARLRGTLRRRSAGRSLRRAVRRLLEAEPNPRIALLARPGNPLAQELGGELPGRGITLVDPDLSDWQVHGRLAGAGPLDLLVDAGDAPARAIDLFRACFLHLRNGGEYVVSSSSPGFPQELARFLDDLTAGRAVPVPAGERRALARTIAGVRREGGRLVVRRRGRTLAKLREREMNEALAVDPSRGRILATVPGTEFDSRCVLRASGRMRKDRTQEHYVAPDLHLREYLDVTCRPKSVVIQRGLLCPDTYRHHLGPRLRHKTLKDVDRWFAITPRNEPPARRLAGTYFHLDNEIRGFFGHALTEQVSQLWGWPEAQERYPGIKVLLSLNRGREVAEWELMLLEAGGIDRADVEVIGEPTRVERLLSATPMFSMPAYVHPRITETWDAVGAALLSRSGARTYPSRIFCSRHHRRRACTNREEVEALFVARGFEVVLPEELSLPEQVALFHQADVIGGFAGSGMFTSMFSDRPKHLILVAPDTYGPSNEYLISAVRGHRLDLAVGRSSSRAAGKSLSAPFEVDMTDEGAWLAAILDDL